MAQGRSTPSGYDWEDDSVPSEPEPLMLPDQGPDGSGSGSIGEPRDAVGGSGPYGAPSFTYAAQEPSADPAGRRGTLPAWAIVAIVAVQAAALVVSVALVLGGLQRLAGADPEPPRAAPTTEQTTVSDPPQQSSPEAEPGTVTDSTGREVTDGTGRYDRPATVGEHTLSWTAWTDGTIGVAALEVDLAATVPAADGQDVVQEGYRLVLVTFEVRYDGPGRLAPAEELWLTGESDRTYFPDVAEGLVPDPMRQIGPLGGGETARFRSAFLVPAGEIDSLRLGVETFSGEPLYFATG